MKQLFLLIFLTSTVSVSGQLDITRVSDSVYVYTTYQNYNGTPFPSNSMYVLTNEGIVMIDTPWDKSQLQPLLDSMQTKHGMLPIACISTHFHDDRTNGVEYLDSIGVKTFATEHTRELCKENGIEAPACAIETDTTYNFGSVKFQIIYIGAGHAPDNIIIYLPQNNLLYGGCFIKSVESESLGYIGDANISAWYYYARLLRKRFPSPEYVITGHQDWRDTSSLKHTIKLLRRPARKERRSRPRGWRCPYKF